MKSDNTIDDEADIKSKTQVKKELLDITKLGGQLIEQPLTTLNRLPLSESVKNAIIDAKTMKKIALKRQIGYIGKLLRNSNYEEVSQAWQKIQAENQLGNQRFHQIETIRNQLISNQQKQQLETFFNQYPTADRQLIRQLAQRARAEINDNKTPKNAYRALFQQIKSITDNEDLE
ncbi:DUF615 domain-containing protein [Thiotrichales bacterium 19S3-7]|nr:DUF615 domain-containing protein [Thiotrichales bacterium 19S3-7]MCF6802952.1 DUF615 domain-containing protein [Thiotrichales bacterium 19S3-11]